MTQSVIHTTHSAAHKSFFLRFSVFLIGLLITALLPLCAQTYPVLTNVYLQSPYSSYLSDYYSSTRERLVVTLLNRDQQEPTLDVRLRVSISSATGLKLQSREETVYPAITLDAGVPVRLTQEDLEPYLRLSNLTGSTFNGKLPDGLVEFTVQAVERYTGKTLSAAATGRVWLSAQKPPLLRLPSNNDQIAFSDPFNLKFQWEPQHKNLSQVEYEFELREIPSTGISPQSAFAYSPVIYSDRFVYTYLLYSAMMPLLEADKIYAWRVRAIAKDGVDELNLFDNNGYSEIYWFTTTQSCRPPLALRASLDDRTLQLSWTPAEGNNEYVVQLREKYAADVSWQADTTTATRRTIYSLTRGATYEYRVGAFCTSGDPVFGETGEVSIPAVDSARLARCGMQGRYDRSNKTPLETLKVGDVVIIGGDFPMTVTKVTSSLGSGTFAGEGWTPLNWLFDTKLAVEFDALTINSDYMQIGGSVRAKYDSTESQVADLDQITEGGVDNTHTGVILPDYTLDVEIPDNPQIAYDEAAGEMTIYSTDGQKITTVSVENNGAGDVFPVTIVDKNGKIIQVDTEKDEDGNAKTDENGNPVLTSKTVGSQGDTFSASSFNRKVVNGDAVVAFERGGGTYAIDHWPADYKKIALIGDNYEILADDYLVPWKFLPVGGSDVVAASVKLTDKKASIDPDSILFATEQGTRFEKRKTAAGTYEITLAAGTKNDVQEIYALYPRDGSSSRFLTLGKLDVVTYAPQTVKLKVVSVNSDALPSGTLQSRLNAVYQPVGVSVDAGIERFDYPGDLDGLISAGADGDTTYSDKLKALITAYRQSLSAAGGSLASDTKYIFVVAGQLR